ncbi:MAG: hypothetical protein DI533_11855 [Cereibacter sphaeroides]|uniref:Sulfotransferase family protein n=1 Tax=Cereibacter sphaeroides TaxID=1063 RepID=A0A2W5UIV4_CERSP|nr:MAG: hypothetical protein DI533_11855 [Cereibacter sphaeroides]
MALAVIGSGFGRTGTKSLKEALERLGLGPCHHMHEAIADPPRVPMWQDAFAGRTVDWDGMFAGYRSQVDWPGAHFWRETAAAYPEAKVIHTVRPEDAWWASFGRTIGKLCKNRHDMPLPPHIFAMLDATANAISKDVFGGDFDDRDKAIAAFRKRTDDVRAALPPERLLIFDVAEGWEPLCSFLGLPVPDEPFPHRNLRADFWEALGGEPQTQ